MSAVFFSLFLLSTDAGFSQGGPPPLPPSLLNQWILGQPDWLDLNGDAPLGFVGLNVASGWSRAGTALSVDTNVCAYLNLALTNKYNEPNLFLDAGTISFWYQPNFTSLTDGGDGPTNWAFLCTIGQWTSNATASSWSLVIDPDGTNLIFLAQSNGASQIVLSAPIDFDAGDWHNICITYCQTSCYMFLEGQPVTNSGPISYMPTDSDCAEYGIFLGSESTNGIFQGRGQFQELQTYDGPLAAYEIAQDYADTSAEILNRGGSLPSTGGFGPDDGPPAPPGGSGGGTNGGGDSPQITNSVPNYSSNQFWLQALPLGTNAFNSNSNAVTFILHATTNASSYQLLTSPSLANAVWTPQQPFVGASGQNWTPITFVMSGQTTLFFQRDQLQPGHDRQRLARLVENSKWPQPQ